MKKLKNMDIIQMPNDTFNLYSVFFHRPRTFWLVKKHQLEARFQIHIIPNN
jgi:hypothetical protein